jgi:hypothetical protein
MPQRLELTICQPSKPLRTDQKLTPPCAAKRQIDYGRAVSAVGIYLTLWVKSNRPVHFLALKCRYFFARPPSLPILPHGPMFALGSHPPDSPTRFPPAPPDNLRKSGNGARPSGRRREGPLPFSARGRSRPPPTASGYARRPDNRDPLRQL